MSDPEDEIKRLKRIINKKNEIISELNSENMKLTNYEIDRYSRQILVPNFGVEGQILLKKASVIIVGAGGLGCPCGLYLAGGGVGHIGIVDYDSVELNNLHRQILHKDICIGEPKVQSFKNSLDTQNNLVAVTTFNVQLDSSNAMEIIDRFDVVVDASDNVATRYLLNDACVLAGKPLVSGSALQMEGQLTVYNYNGGPCYRCLFPAPPPPETVTNCGTGGVLGPIPGVIGVLQALETIKILLNQTSLSKQLILFDGTDCSFRKVTLRGRNEKCAVCGTNPTITELIDYEQFCGSKANDKNPNLSLLEKSMRLSVEEYVEMKDRPHVLLDVRSEAEFQICKLPGSVNIPITVIQSDKSKHRINMELQKLSQQTAQLSVVVVCRRGNDSQKAVLALKKHLQSSVILQDLVGGLHSWASNIDTTFPVY